jgi:hypothetical protein
MVALVVVLSILASTTMQLLVNMVVPEAMVVPATQLEVLALATTTAEVLAMQSLAEALAVSAADLLALLAATSPEM